MKQAKQLRQIGRSLSLLIIAGVITLGTGVLGSTDVNASSHREAPTISGDPKADATDVYAFVSPDKPDTVTLMANYLPFQEPAGGPNFYQFGDDVLYEIKVDNNGDATQDISYQFRFKTTVKNPKTFLYNTGAVKSVDDPALNIAQTYTLTKVQNGVSTVLGTDIPTSPSNVGPKSTPDYATLQKQAVRQAGDVTTYAGQSDDPFFADLGGLFDLLTIRQVPGNMGGGIDGLKGYNVQSLALQIPISQLTADGTVPADAAAANSVIGVWTTASRQSTKVLNSDGTQTATGNFVQVSRLGAPLVNEVVIPVGDKDRWNSSQPADDGQFANYVTNPELGGLLNGLYGIKVPPQGDFGTAAARDDLVAIFLTGIPGLTKPANVVPSEQLRLNVGVPPTAQPNKMGVLGGDKAGYPNGRRLADDTVDISLQAVAGAAYPLFHPEFTPDPLATQLGDGVDTNDAAFRGEFPYTALPVSGFESVPHATNASNTPPVPGSGNGNNGNGKAKSEAAIKKFNDDTTVAKDKLEMSLQKSQDKFANSKKNRTAREDFKKENSQAKAEFHAQLTAAKEAFVGQIRSYESE